MTTLELALAMSFVCAVVGALAWWTVAGFDREFGKIPKTRNRRHGEA